MTKHSKEEVTHLDNTGWRKRKKSEYAIQLMERSKAKYSYGILEKQFRGLFKKHQLLKVTGEVLLQLCEARLIT
jgi:small subunit ribosomal protein S4